MKKIIQTSGVLTMFLFLIACKKESNSPDANNTTTTASTVMEGSWTITSYTQRTENKTNNYAGINFSFSNDGKLVATGTNSAAGTYSITPPSTGYYSSSSSVATFTINLGTSSPFNKLTNVWNVAEQTSTTLRLDNREITEDEHITFSKK
jgi:hypothetical protein